MLTASLFGLFGLIVGSFLNVLIIRHGVRSVRGRSGCMACGVQLRPQDMIPVLSWLFLRGRCRVCRTQISIQYPLVEATTGILFAMIGGSPFIGIVYKVLFCVIVAIYVAIVVYDIRHTIIPDSWAYASAGVAFIVSGSLVPFADVGAVLLHLVSGPIAAAPLFLLWLVSKGRWMGLGDPKLALGIGWLLGPVSGITAVFFAFIIGAVVSVGVLMPLPHIMRTLHKYGITSLDMLRGGFTMKSEIPFGPFLIASCIIIWLCQLYGVDPLQYLGLPPAYFQ